jgi:hypothetical protein
MTTQTLYKVIGFGTSKDYGLFNQFCCSSSIGYAQGFYNGFYNDPEYCGAVLIKCSHEEWEVIQEFGTEGYSVVCGPLFNHKVEKSPQLIMV